jgi:hypothetical protein
MDKYINNFVKEEIDMETVVYFTESNLRRIGIDSLGARLCICSAIDKLKADSLPSGTFTLCCLNLSCVTVNQIHKKR